MQGEGVLREDPPEEGPEEGGDAFLDAALEGGAAKLPDFADGHFRVKRLFFLIFAASIALFHIGFNTVILLPGLVQGALHFAFFAFLCATFYPAGKNSRSKQTVAAYRLLNPLLGLCAAFAALYLAFMEEAIHDRGVKMTLFEVGLATVAILSAIEFTRRVTGWIIPILTLAALGYAMGLGDYIPGMFHFPGMRVDTILFRSIFGDDGMFGTIARISSSYVFIFIVFGAFLQRSGAGDFIIALACLVAGRFAGGSGLIAVFASALTGMISGSAVANTASTGVVTIPLMKRSGFKPRFAAGVEAASSTGGQIMPPIMGAGAFVMSSFTQIPYLTIVAVSIVPALLYFASVAVQVRLHAVRHNVGLLHDGDLSLNQRARTVLRQRFLPFSASIGLLLFMLIDGYTPVYAACFAILACVGASWLTPHPMTLRAITEALALGTYNMTTTAILLVTAGLVVNVIGVVGIGNTFSLMIVDWAGGYLLLTLVLVAIASVILGMGLPVTASYIVLATLSAPALYQLIVNEQLVEMIVSGVLPEAGRAVLFLAFPEQAGSLEGMEPDSVRALLGALPLDLFVPLSEQILPEHALLLCLLSAHLIVFWLSQDSNVTPPVCLAAFTAAAIARTAPMATGMTSWGVAKGLYLIPYLFAYTHLIGGSALEIIRISFFALGAMISFSGAMQAYLFGSLGVFARIFAIFAGIAMLWPDLVVANVAGFALLVYLAGASYFFKVRTRSLHR